MGDSRRTGTFRPEGTSGRTPPRPPLSAASGRRTATPARRRHRGPPLPPDPQTRRRPDPGTAWLASAFVVSFALRLWLSRNRVAPVWHEDGLGYLAAAKLLSGSSYTLTVGPMGFYNAGYGLLLAPAFWFADTAAQVFDRVLVINALTTAGVVWPLTRLVEHLRPTIGPRDAVLAAFAATNYTAYLLRSNYTFADNLWHVLFVVLLLTTVRYLRTLDLRLGAAAAVLLAGTYSVHPRGVATVAVGLVLLGVAVWRRIVPRVHGLVLGPLIALASGAAWALNYYVRTRAYLGVDSRMTGQSGQGALDPTTWPTLVLRGSGQLWYLLLTTAALLVLGVWTVFRLRGERDDLRWAAVVTAALTVAVGGVSMLVMGGATRYDHLWYGRYNEGALAPLLALGVAAAIQHPRRSSRLLLTGVAASFVLAAVNGLLYRGAFQMENLSAPINVLGLLPFEIITGGRNLLAQTALAALVSVVLTLTVRLGWTRTGVLALVVWWVASAGMVESVRLRHFDRPFEQKFSLALEVAEQVDDLGALAIDRSVVRPDAANFYGWSLPRVHVLHYTEGPPPAPYVISHREPPVPGARAFALEPGTDRAAWVVPGPELDELASRGALFPTDFLALPPEARAFAVGEVDLPEQAEPGELVELTLTLTHTGTGSPWAPFWALPDGQGSVRPFLAWRPCGALTTRTLRAVDLGSVTYPGETAVLPTAIETPTVEGCHDLWVLVQLRGVDWFPADTGRILDTVIIDDEDTP